MELIEQQKLEILCAYLPYGVDMVGCQSKLSPKILQRWLDDEWEIDLILRHRDDMTEVELKHLANNWGAEFGKSIMADETPMYLSHAKECLRYLHSIHIDTFGAIESGFAIRK